VLVLPELMSEPRVFAGDVTDIKIEVFNQFIRLSEFVILVRSRRAFTERLEDLIEERNCPEILDLALTLIKEDVLLLALLSSGLLLFFIPRWLGVVIKELVFTFGRGVDGVNHVLLGQQVSSPSHGIGFNQELHFQRVKANDAVHFLTEIVGKHDSHGPELSEHDLSALIDFAAMVADRPLHLCELLLTGVTKGLFTGQTIVIIRGDLGLDIILKISSFILGQSVKLIIH